MSGGQLLLLQDLDDNDSDKSFTVPAGKAYELLYGSVELISTATVGNRQLVIEITDGTEIIYRIHAGTTQAASLTRHYLFGQGNVRETSFVDGTLMTPLPTGLLLKPSYVIRVYDSGAVDAAADDMDVSIMVKNLPLTHGSIT
jgi:hypothetical protein